MKKNKTAFLLIIALFASSCAITRKTFSNKYYNETFSGYIINNETTELVLIGNNYDYFLQDNDKKIQALYSCVNLSNLNLFNSYGVLKGGEIYLRASIETKKQQNEISTKDIKCLNQAGLVLNNKQKISGIINLSGSVHKKNDSTSVYNKFSQPILFNFVEVEPTRTERATKIIFVAPFTIIADIILSPYYLFKLIDEGVGGKVGGK